MEPRMPNPVFTVPGAMQALVALSTSTKAAGLPESLLELVNLRASQINGCSMCVDMHSKALHAAGESLERIFAVGAWREAPYFTDGERAALALAECMTRLSDRADAVPDDVFDEAADHFSADELSALIISIATINVWNRLNATVRQVAGPIAG